MNRFRFDEHIALGCFIGGALGAILLTSIPAGVLGGLAAFIFAQGLYWIVVGLRKSQ